MRKFLSAVICISLVLNTFSLAQENIMVEDIEDVIIPPTTKDITEMTLEEAIVYAIKNNSQVVDIQRMERDQKDAYDDAKSEYQKWKNKLRSGGYSFETVQEYLDCYGYGLKTATLSYNSFIATKGATEKSVAYSIKNMAYNIKKLENNIELLEKSIEKQTNDVQIAEVKLRLNMITENEYDKILTTLDTSRLELIALKDSLNNLQINLKKTMGFDVLSELKIILPEYETSILEIENLNEVIENSLTTNKSAIAAEIEYNKKEINNMLATKTYWLETRDDIRNAKEAFKDAESRLINEKNAIKEGILLLYNSVKTNEESIALAGEEYSRAKTQVEQAKVMYEIGMISKNAYLGYEISFMNAKYAYDEAVTENILLNERWAITISVGDVISGS